ncbi:hypothetical protein CONPUDRAFT_47377 [Coniophora puteana RWD-64-598 SS2]|uniref:DUF1766-domain-containing protein n=1 Tax=Coniophora puteana (strain RWD-64-598) TaxID=741705 RepID=A0A5M3N242_CONPW|nr:uncharacterized protein CONPUDRAFT_47377 [Coniophora puteana RWD-64-598 SS2]EIW85453.1 hypothetical protein CONPUDRAFT_47377 [Coniophora puteana RWD-64-598 SS2]
MQYALGGSPPPTPPKSASPPKQPAPSTPPRPSKLAPPAFDRPRPSSDSALSPPNVKSPKTRKAKSTSPTETPEPAPCTPPRHKRATSSPPSPTLSAATSSPGKDSVRCSGFTKASQPCKRMVKVGPALATLDPDLDVERFCHQHRDEIGKQNGFTAFKNGQYVEFDTWIPKYLHPDTQAVLRAVMAKPKSGSDKDGYIYTYEIRDKHTPDVVHLKVGRATTLNQRLDQWQKQCSSKEQVVRGWWPASADGDEGSLLRGLIKAGPAGPLCHRLERLIHLELADLVVHTPYLDPHWPNVNHDDLAVSSKKNAKTALYKKNHQPCLDCGAVHKEIFSFKRVEEGYYENKEWELIVKPVIEKWGFFVETYV